MGLGSLNIYQTIARRNEITGQTDVGLMPNIVDLHFETIVEIKYMGIIHCDLTTVWTQSGEEKGTALSV